LPLSIPNLDDRTFDDLCTEALALIPRNLPQWTDYNPSDPGITLLELFAFVVEAAIYQINRVPDRTLLNFASLIGVTPLAGETVLQTLTRAQQAAAVRTSVVTGDDFESAALQVAVLQLTVQSITGTVIVVSPFDAVLGYPAGTRVSGQGSITTQLNSAIPANSVGLTQVVVNDVSFASSLSAGDTITISPIGRSKALVQTVALQLTVQSTAEAVIAVSPFNTVLAYPAGTPVSGPGGATTQLNSAIPAYSAVLTQVAVNDASFASRLNAGDTITIAPDDAYPPDQFVQLIVVPTTAPSLAGVDLRQTIFETLRAVSLISTYLKVTDASYTELSVVATIVADSSSHMSTSVIQQNVTNALTTFFDPLVGGTAGTGWPFGRSVFRSELYQVIQGIEGVDHVQDLLLNGDPLIGEVPLNSADSLVSLTGAQVTVTSD